MGGYLGPRTSKPVTMHQLDFALLPSADTITIVHGLGSELHDALSTIPQTRNRAKCAIAFATDMKDDKLHLWMREGYLRAALAEFVSMEEALKREVQEADWRRANHSANPLLHIIRELRNLEVHLRSGPMSSARKAFMCEDRTMPDGWHHLDLTVWSIQRVTVQEFTQLVNAKRYNQSDIASMLDWFNDAQQQCGVGELVEQATKTFASEIAVSLRLLPVPI